MKKLDPSLRVWLIAAIVGVALTVGASLAINHFSEQKPEVDAGEAVDTIVRLVDSTGCANLGWPRQVQRQLLARCW